MIDTNLFTISEAKFSNKDVFIHESISNIQLPVHSKSSDFAANTAALAIIFLKK